jgi:hypothetical protein
MSAVGTAAEASPQWIAVRNLSVVEPAVAVASVEGWAGSRVAAGHVVQTGYVDVHDVVVYARGGHHLSPAAVERAYCRQLELGDDQAWPPLTGYWRDDGRFVLTDGRHRFIAAVMLGVEYVLVAWLVAPADTCSRCNGTKLDGHGEPCQFCTS